LKYISEGIKLEEGLGTRS